MEEPSSPSIPFSFLQISVGEEIHRYPSFNNMNAFILTLPSYQNRNISLQGFKKVTCWKKSWNTTSPINLVHIKAVTLQPLKANISKLLQVSSAVASVFAYSSHCLATEGTGEPLGVDDPRVLVVLTIIPILVFLLWLQFNGQQSNDDFLDTYDQRRR